MNGCSHHTHHQSPTLCFCPSFWPFLHESHPSTSTNQAEFVIHPFNELTMPATTAETLSLVTRNVTVAPLVLLSAVDHYNRTASKTKRRVVGVLLGSNDGKSVRVSNSFAGSLSPPSTHPTWSGAYLNTQFPSKKMTRTPQCGSSTTIMSSP